LAFQDHFSGHANAYARYRPEYPQELFEYLATLTPGRAVALDCATGNGQAAVGLASHFDLVVASDGSLSQLRSAQAHPHVAYLCNLAEQPALKDGSVDLAAAAQAAHWFDHARFHPEMRRVLRPDGALALWTYGRTSIAPPIDAVVRHFYENVVGPHWPPERRHVENAYRDLPFPWREVAVPQFQLHMDWMLDDFLGYVGTWSATQRYTKVSGADPLPALRAQIAPLWGCDSRPIAWPLHLRVGRP
jgi:ubiquinone/menaquinone biosynthesis C-methylase UbiE